MPNRLLTVLRLACLLLAASLAPSAARAETEVDLQLVIAVDVSYSMDPDEQALQRGGFADAFHSPVVHDAIRRGAVGRIAVTYVEWAGATDQRVLLPWTVLDGPAAANAFADELERRPTRRAARTSISGAIDFAVRAMDEAGFLTDRRVIDVSGDGANNQGRPVLAARADALAKGLTINGLPLMLKAPGYFDIADLDLYYRDCVIGGPGAFMVPVRDKDGFRDAVKTKIIMEIASRPVPGRAAARDGGASVRLAAAEGAGDPRRCLSGEMQWRDRMGN